MVSGVEAGRRAAVSVVLSPVCLRFPIQKLPPRSQRLQSCIVIGKMVEYIFFCGGAIAMAQKKHQIRGSVYDNPPRRRGSLEVSRFTYCISLTCAESAVSRECSRGGSLRAGAESDADASRWEGRESDVYKLIGLPLHYPHTIICSL